MSQHSDANALGERFGLPPAGPRCDQQTQGDDCEDNPQDDRPRTARGWGSDRRDPPTGGNLVNDVPGVVHDRYRIGALGMREAVIVQPTFLTPARLMASMTCDACMTEPLASARNWTRTSG